MNLAAILLPLLRGLADREKDSPFAEDIMGHVRNVEAIIARHETAKEAELVSFAVGLFSPQAAAAQATEQPPA